MNYGALKEKKIKSLLWIKDRETFEATYAEIMKDLKTRKFQKSINYLRKKYEIKHKWARRFLPWIFTGGVDTTSRAESINSLSKRFVDSTCELSDLIKFLVNFERKTIFEASNLETSVINQYNKHEIVLQLRIS